MTDPLPAPSEEKPVANRTEEAGGATLTPGAPGPISIERLDRSAAAAIDGFRYQALHALRYLLTLTPGQRVIIEGAEDIVVEGAAPAGFAADQFHPQQRLQVKNTTSAYLNWTDDDIYKSILEFLIQYAQLGPGADVEFGIVTPAKISGPRDTFITEWRKRQHEGTIDQRFVLDLETRMRGRLTKSSVSENLRRAVTEVLERVSKDQLTAFAHRVRWHDLEKPTAGLTATLVGQLRDLAARHGLEPEAALHLLMDTILFRATQDPAQRVLDASFVETTLAAARPLAADWAAVAQAVRFIERADAALVRIDAKLDQGFEAVGRMHAEMQEQHLQAQAERREQQATLDQVLALQRQLLSAKTSDPPYSDRLAALAGSDITDLIARARYTQALALIDLQLPSAPAERIGPLIYLRTFALSGSNPANAIQLARRDLERIPNGDWRILVDALAQFLGGATVDFGPLWTIATGSDQEARVTARILIAEIAYRDDQPATMLEATGDLQDDPRALRLVIRAHADQDDLATARRLMGERMDPQDPERARMEAHLDLREFFIVLPTWRSALPPDFADRCRRLADTISRALGICPDDALRRRQELLANRGVVRLWGGDETAAIADLTAAIEVDGSVPQPHQVLAGIFARRGEFAPALTHARSAAESARHAHQAEIRVDAKVVAASFALVGVVSREEAERLLSEAIAENGVAAVHRERAMLMRIRIRAQLRDAAGAQVALDEWTTAVHPPLKLLAEAILAHHQRQSERVLALVDALDADQTTDLQTRHEATLFRANALLALNGSAEAANQAMRALGMGLGDIGAELALDALHGSGRVTEAEALEARLLARDPKDLRVWLGRRQRLQRSGALTQAVEPAVRVAEITGDPTEAFNAAAIAWNAGDDRRAAELIAPVADRLTHVQGVRLAAECAYKSGVWERSLQLAIRAHGLDPADRASTAYLMSSYLRVQNHIQAVDEASIAYIRKALEALPDGEPNAAIRREQFDAQVLLESVQARHAYVSGVFRAHQNEHGSAIQFSTAVGIPLTQAIGAIMDSPDLNLFLGSVQDLEDDIIQLIDSLIDTLILDLPSFVLFSRMGLLPTLRTKWRLRLSSDHQADLRAYRDSVAEELAAAEAGRLHHLGIAGPTQRQPEPIREQLAILDSLMADRERWCEVFEPQPSTAVEDTQHPPLTAWARLLMHQQRRNELLVIAEQRWHRPDIRHLTFNDTILLCEKLRLMPWRTLGHACVTALRLGVNRIHVPVDTLSWCYSADGDRVGPRTRCVMRELRSGKWRRPALRLTVVHVAAMWARHMTTVGRAEIDLLAGLLHSRAFKGPARPQAFAMLPRLARLVTSSAPADVQQRVLAILARAISTARRGDPFASDPRFPGRTRVLGRRVADEWNGPFP